MKHNVKGRSTTMPMLANCEIAADSSIQSWFFLYVNSGVSTSPTARLEADSKQAIALACIFFAATVRLGVATQFK